MTPTWPQLAGWLATVHIPAAYGTAVGPDVGGEVAFALDGDRLELRWPDGRRFADDGTRAVLVDAGGAATLHRDGEAATVRRLLRPRPLHREDFHRAAAPPRPVTVAGRAGWRVDLAAPPHKHGHWQLVVDDETGCVLSTAHDLEGPQVALTRLVLGADPGADYGYEGPEPIDPTAQGRHESGLWDAGRGPTVHSSPRGYWADVVHADGDRVLVELDAEHPGLRLSVAPTGAEPLDPGPFHPHHVVRDRADGRWLLATSEPLSVADADRVLGTACWVPAPVEPARPPG